MFVGMSYRQIVLSSLPDSSCVVEKNSTACTAELCGCACRSIVFVSTSNSFTFPFSSPAVSSFPSWRKFPASQAAPEPTRVRDVHEPREALDLLPRLAGEKDHTTRKAGGAPPTSSRRKPRNGGAPPARMKCDSQGRSAHCAIRPKPTSFVSLMLRNDFQNMSTPDRAAALPLSEVFADRAVGTLFGATGLNSIPDMSKQRLP